MRAREKRSEVGTEDSAGATRNVFELLLPLLGPLPSAQMSDAEGAAPHGRVLGSPLAAAASVEDAHEADAVRPSDTLAR